MSKTHWQLYRPDAKKEAEVVKAQGLSPGYLHDLYRVSAVNNQPQIKPVTALDTSSPSPCQAMKSNKHRQASGDKCDQPSRQILSDAELRAALAEEHWKRPRHS